MEAISEPCMEINVLSHKVIGAAIEVHRELGPGFIESAYEEALAHELALRGIKFNRQHLFAVRYKDREVGQGKLDFLIEDQLVLELKAVDQLHPIHRTQVISYLRATRKKLGLLINFNVELLKDGIERIANTRG